MRDIQDNWSDDKQYEDEKPDVFGNFCEGERVVIDKGSIDEQFGTIAFFYGDGNCEVHTDYGDRYPVNIYRLSKL